MALKGAVRQHIGHDGYRLAGTHMRQLVFLEVGVNPQAVRGTSDSSCVPLLTNEPDHARRLPITPSNGARISV